MLRLIILAGALSVAASAASAHDRHGHGGGRMLEHADTNQDGTVTRDEFLAARTQMFTRFDRNSDGVLDDADRREHASPQSGEHGGKMREQIDANNDGKVTKEEFTSAGAPLFDQADSDGNGVLGKEELEAVKAKAKERAQEWRSKRSQQSSEQSSKQ
jgi:hypothetical protein